MPTTKTPDAKSGIEIREPKFVNIGGLYLARRAVAEGEPRFVMELNVADLGMLLIALSAVLPEGKKLAGLQGDEDLDNLGDDTIDHMHVLGDSVRELLIRATQHGHNHMWHCLVSGLDDGATVAEQALTAYGREVADERPDEMDALEAAAKKDGPHGPQLPDSFSDDEEPLGVTLSFDGVTAPHCGVIIDT